MSRDSDFFFSTRRQEKVTQFEKHDACARNQLSNYVVIQPPRGQDGLTDKRFPFSGGANQSVGCNTLGHICCQSTCCLHYFFFVVCSGSLVEIKLVPHRVQH